MRVDHGGLDVGVAEKFLHRADVLAGFQQMGGEAVPKAVRREANRQPGLPYGFLHRALDALFVNVVSPDVAAARVLREIVRRKDILPAPLKGSRRILARQRAGNLDLVHVSGLVRQVLLLPSFEPPLQFLAVSRRQRDVAVLVSFGFAHDNAVLIELHFLHAQPRQPEAPKREG